MTQQAVSSEILKAVEGRFSAGDSFRMHHRKKLDGTECTPMSKDPALTVTRTKTGWVYCCHRCGSSGAIWDNALSPSQTDKRLKALQQPSTIENTGKITLPNDFIRMTNPDTQNIPAEAYQWLWKYSLSKEDITKYNIGWSPNYQRVIIPLYDFTQHGADCKGELMGWVGREVMYKDKVEREKNKVSKYFNRMAKGERKFFMTLDQPAWDKVIICEDIISAIKVHKATGYIGVALLTTSISSALFRWLKNREVWLWLDGDMLAKSVGLVERMRQLGIAAKNVHTQKDPKEYKEKRIRKIIERKGK